MLGAIPRGNVRRDRAGWISGTPRWGVKAWGFSGEARGPTHPRSTNPPDPAGGRGERERQWELKLELELELEPELAVCLNRPVSYPGFIGPCQGVVS